MGDPIAFARTLKWYKRRDVANALVDNGRDREVSVRYGEGFGKRPDILAYPADVVEFAKRKVTSFHCSEERWRDPLAIVTGMSRKQLDDLRIGWDLVLDIDCPHWEFSKLTTQLFINALKEHGITSMTCKFSGNKGFHIGVPFEAFPPTYGEEETKNLFPEAPRALAAYLLDYIERHFVDVQETNITFGKIKTYTLDELKKIANTIGKRDKLLVNVCTDCGNERKSNTNSDDTGTVLCPQCEHKFTSTKEHVKCPTCGHVFSPERNAPRKACEHCQSALPPITKFNVQALIEVDTILLASRHLYRAPYALHEKSGLVSVAVDPDNVLAFDKQVAKTENVKEFPEFLPRDVPRGEGTELLGKAMIHNALLAQTEVDERKAYEAPEEAIEEEYFPPCIKFVLNGIRDGKKRALFILTNFFYSCGWSSEMIKDVVYDWNERNPEKLREVNIKGHLQLKSKKKEIIMPPNCSSDYYRAIGMCKPDDFCKTIKNPAQYALKKYRLANFRKDGARKAKREPLTPEQKEARRLYRERKKRKEETKKEKGKQ